MRLNVPLKKGIELNIRIFLSLLTSHIYRESPGMLEVQRFKICFLSASLIYALIPSNDFDLLAAK